MTLGDAIEGFWLDKRARLSRNTVTDYSLTFHRLLRAMGGSREIDTITSDDLRRFVDKIKQAHALKEKSVINIYIALSSLWTWANRELGIPQVVKGITRPKYNAPVVEVYTRAEISLMLGATGRVADWKSRTGNRARPRQRPTELRDRAIILTLLDSGIRASELTGLIVKDIDLDTGHVTIRRGKGNKSRVLYIGEATRKAIWRYLSGRSAYTASAPLFATGNNTSMDNDSLGRMIRTCATRAGVSHAYPHKFRHTFAITFLRNGGNVLELQAILGHSNLETLKVYVRLAQTDLQSAAKRSSPADHWHL